MAQPTVQRKRPIKAPSENTSKGSVPYRNDSGAADHIRDIINGGALSLALSMGHRTGLWDALSRLPHATSTELATEAGLDERYVREWLGAVAAGGIVRYRTESGTYELPREYAKLLTRRAAPDNLAVASQFIPMLASVEDDIVECFRRGGGVGYRAFPRFHEVMSELSSQTVVSALYEHILPLVSGLQTELETGIDVLDVGCGEGRALVSLASVFPNSRFRGVDISRPAIRVARRTVKKLGLRNLAFDVADAAKLRLKSKYDLITAFDSIHDQAKPDTVLGAIRSGLREGGVFLMQDIASETDLGDNLERPWAPFFYSLSYNHCMTVSLERGGAGLGTCWGRHRASAMLKEAGFAEVDQHSLEHDLFNDFYVARPARG